jgi:hypothetical protein
LVEVPDAAEVCERREQVQLGFQNPQLDRGRAGVEACRSAPGGGSDADAMARFETCRRDIVARAVKQLGSPSVQAAYEARPIRLA